MKKWKLMVLVSALMSLLLGMHAMAADADFVINADGMLVEYKGNGGDVEIPPGVTSIGEVAFAGCTGLKSVSIPDSVTSVLSWAFAGCTNVTSVTIPASVTDMGECVFENCTGLKSVKIPDSVTEIAAEMFKNCSSLTDVTIPGKVTLMGGGVFRGCTNLTSVTIPASVTEIEEALFEGCDKLADIYYGGSRQQWAAITYGFENEKVDDMIPAWTTIHYNSLGPDDSNGGASDGSDNKNDGQSSANTGTINIIVSDPKYNTLQLTWLPVEGAASYEVYYSDSPTGEFKLLKKVKKPKAVKFSKANCGQTYYFKVVAYQKSGKELIPCGSGKASGKTKLTGDLNLSEKSKYDSVALKWKKIKGVKEYEVRRSDGVVVSGLKSAKYTDPNVETGKTYTYTVTAVSYGEDTIVSEITAHPSLSKAPKLKVKASGTDSLTLSWSKVPGAVFYDVYSVDMITGEPVLLESLRAPQTVYSVTDLNSATPYKYMVVARAGDCKKPSRQAVQTTKAIKQ